MESILTLKLTMSTKAETIPNLPIILHQYKSHEMQVGKINSSDPFSKSDLLFEGFFAFENKVKLLKINQTACVSVNHFFSPVPKS